MRVRFHSVVKSTSTQSAFCAVAVMTHITAILVTAQESSVQNSNRRDNPFLTESPLPYHIPPFDKIKDEHFAPAM